MDEPPKRGAHYDSPSLLTQLVKALASHEEVTVAKNFLYGKVEQFDDPADIGQRERDLQNRR